jgi:hypothetical protein
VNLLERGAIASRVAGGAAASGSIATSFLRARGGPDELDGSGAHRTGCAPCHLVVRHVLDVGLDAPPVTERILDQAGAVPEELIPNGLQLVGTVPEGIRETLAVLVTSADGRA